MRIKPIFVILLVLLFSIITDSIMADVSRQNDLVVRGLRVEKADVRKSSGIRGQLSVMPGDKIGIRFSVVNKKGRSGPFHIGVYLATSNSLNDLNPNNRIFHIPVRSLSENQRALIINKKYKIPMSCRPGNYHVVAFADADNQVSETSESNNRASVALKVKRFQPKEVKTQTKRAYDRQSIIKMTDIAVQNLAISDHDVHDDELILVTFQAKNLGSTRIAEVSYEIFMALELYGDKYEFGNGVFRNIGPGEHIDFRRRYKIPWNINPDNFKNVYVLLNRNKNPLRENNYKNNFQHTGIHIHLLKLPDLTVTRLQRRGSNLPHEDIVHHLDFTVRNIGRRKSVPCKYNISMTSIYRKKMYRQPSLWTGRVENKSYDIYPLSPNEAMTGTVSFNMPPKHVFKGDYQYTLTSIEFKMCVDIEKQNTESNEENNCKKIICRKSEGGICR